MEHFLGLVCLFIAYGVVRELYTVGRAYFKKKSVVRKAQAKMDEMHFKSPKHALDYASDYMSTDGGVYVGVLTSGGEPTKDKSVETFTLVSQKGQESNAVYDARICRGKPQDGDLVTVREYEGFLLIMARLKSVYSIKDCGWVIND